MSDLSQSPIYLNAMGVANALGRDWLEVSNNLFAGERGGLDQRFALDDGRMVPVGQLRFDLDPLPPSLSNWESRNNRLTQHCLSFISKEIEQAKEKYGVARVGAVIGTSTSGISQTETHLNEWAAMGRLPPHFDFSRQELGDPAAFVAATTSISGPYFGVSTACTSGARALASAVRLLRANMCDAVIAGGVDTLCRLTLNGFSVLDSVASERCNPFSANRTGINIGEGGALFLVTREASEIRLAGWGESADAYHLNAPDPEGAGARLAIEQALAMAKVDADDISYLNLHGTATRLNDAMEAKVTSAIFGNGLSCSSTKGMTGHMLGAAGAGEAAFTAMALQRGKIPPHIWDGECDPALARIHLVDEIGERIMGRYAMSCSYAFGGNNASLILARE